MSKIKFQLRHNLLPVENLKTSINIGADNKSLFTLHKGKKQINHSKFVEKNYTPTFKIAST